MLDRRGVLRAASLAVLTPPLLAACRNGGGTEIAHETSQQVSSPLSRAPADGATVPSAVRSMWALGSGLWGLAGTAGNFALSPYSIAVALAMTANGADGDTHREMMSVLGVRSDDELNHGLNALTQQIEALADRKVTLDAANQLFGQRDVAWEQAFLDVLARQYGAGIRTVDFKRAAEAARLAVNAWTAERTHDRIEEILPPGSVDGLTRLVLVNALYFKAPWLEPFEKSLTQSASFHLPAGNVVDVPMMRGTLGAAYAAGDGWQSVRIPYVNGDLAMTVVLPDPERDLDVATLPDVLAVAPSDGIELTLPRWTFRTEAMLKQALADLGMPTAFDDSRVDLTRMTESDDHLLVSDVFHQVFVAVNEEGTEAAAATAVVVSETSAMVAQRHLVVDRPFLFVIHDVEHGTPLFVGRVDDPNS